MRLHFLDMKGNKLDTLQSCTAILVAATATYSSSLQPRNRQLDWLHELKKQQLVKERKIIVCPELTPHPNMLEECIAIRIATAVQKKWDQTVHAANMRCISVMYLAKLDMCSWPSADSKSHLIEHM